MRTLRDLREEMRAVARGEVRGEVRGETTPPVRTCVETEAVAGVLGVLTPANLTLMRLIASERPESVSRLAELSGRSQPNVSRALQDLARCGLVRLMRDGMSIRPELAAVEVDVKLALGTCEVIPCAEVSR